MKSGSSCSQRSGLGPIIDQFARDWFIKIVEHLETKVAPYIEVNGDPEDWSIFFHKKQWETGLMASVFPIRTKEGRLEYVFSFWIRKHIYEGWARKHLYLMEDVLSFRIGPIIFAHPGRHKIPIKVKDKSYPRPISVWDMEQGFLAGEGTNFFKLSNGTIKVNVYKTNNNNEQTCWHVERVK